MRLFKLLILALVMLSSSSYASPDEEMIGTWNMFLDGLSKKDLAVVLQKSASEIRCWPCVVTPGDGNVFSADEFYAIISGYLFSDRLLHKLQTGKIFFLVNDGGASFEVIVTTTEPSEAYPNHEGVQTAFNFKKHNDEYIFTRLSTIS